MKKYFKEFDYPLFITYFILCIFGLIMIYSASMMVAVNRLGQEPDFFYKKQLLNLIISAFAFMVGVTIPYKKYRKKPMFAAILAITFIFLGAVHLAGYSPSGSGAKSWLNFGFANFQPSELAKLSFIILFAVVFANKNSNGTIDSIKHSILPMLVVFGVALFLIFLEPDIGSMGMLLAIGVCVIMVSGISIKTFTKLMLPFFAILATGLLILYSYADVFLTERRLGRMKAFLNPFNYETSYGLQVANGYYAIGVGGISGTGLGQSVQKLGYLPEPQTDFILAIIAEELGMFGVIIVLGGIGFIVMRAIVIGIRAKDPMARIIAIGIASWIGIQTFVNVGGLSGLIPLTGVTLPFISYGGSSIVLLSLAMGILINVSMFVKKERN